jgi:hypothetical protein
MRQTGRVRSVVRALDRILRDEVLHRDFGWALLEWLLTTPAAHAFRSQLSQELPAMLRRVRAHYGASSRERLSEAELEREALAFSDSRRSWGLLPRAGYLAAVDETFERDYRPRFRTLQIDIDD